MRLQHRQAGWTFYGLLFTVLIGGTFLTVGFKLAPAYADWYTLKNVMENMVNDRPLLAKSKAEIKRSLASRMGINNLKLPKDFVTITKDKGDVYFDVHYEIRTDIFRNVDAVMTFEQRFEGKELE